MVDQFDHTLFIIKEVDPTAVEVRDTQRNLKTEWPRRLRRANGANDAGQIALGAYHHLRMFSLTDAQAVQAPNQHQSGTDRGKENDSLPQPIMERCREEITSTRNTYYQQRTHPCRNYP